MENSNTNNYIKDKETLLSKFEKITSSFTDLSIVMDVKDFFSCVQKESLIKTVSFNNCKFNLFSKNGNIGMDLGYGVQFENCIFDNPIYWVYFGLKSNTGKSGIDFNKCIFREDITIATPFQGVDSKFPIQIKFSICKIEKSCTLKTLKTNRQPNINTVIVVFDKNIIKGDVNIIECDQLEVSLISENPGKISIIDSNISSIEIADIYDIYIQNCTIEPQINLNNKEQVFYKITFNKEFNYKGKIINKLEAKECYFNDIVNLDKSQLNDVCFDESKFLKKVYCIDAEIKKISFSNCKFYDTVKIVNVKNLSEASFERSSIEGLFFFNGWNETMGLFENAKVDFSHLYITSQGYLIIRNINNGFFNFSFSNILGTLNIQDSEIQQINLDKCAIRGLLHYENIKVQESPSRESIVRIKDSFSKRGDSINALLYRGIEMSAYRSELWKEIKKGKMQKIADLFLLGMNTISNYNGRWWFLGVLFTILVSFLFYSLYSLSMGFCEFSLNISKWAFFDANYWAKVLSFLWLPNLDGFKELTNPETKASLWSHIWFISGKIFIAYGIYQTISAFRKYIK